MKKRGFCYLQVPQRCGRYERCQPSRPWPGLHGQSLRPPHLPHPSVSSLVLSEDVFILEVSPDLCSGTSLILTILAKAAAPAAFPARALSVILQELGSQLLGLLQVNQKTREATDPAVSVKDGG